MRTLVENYIEVIFDLLCLSGRFSFVKMYWCLVGKNSKLD